MDGSELVSLNNSNTRLRQRSSDLERTCKKLKNSNKKLLKQIKIFMDENQRLRRKLVEFERKFKNL